MIYRIILRHGRDPEFNNVALPTVGSASLSLAMDKEMRDMGFKPPKKHFNMRAKFYFTELGWDTFGRKLYTIAIQKGYGPKVITLKNPKRSDTAYHDSYQVAILPRKGDGD
jgi:hypothetical protein